MFVSAWEVFPCSHILVNDVSSSCVWMNVCRFSSSTALFAFREVPSEATGYPPFTLMFGRDVRGPLHLLREGWETPNTKRVTVLQYLKDLQERFTLVQDTKTLQESKMKLKSKDWYDKNAVIREFEVGGSVWLMEPDTTTKMAMKWKGPYTITKKISPINYVIEMEGRLRVTHINQLKANTPPFEIHQIGVNVEEMDNDIPIWREGSTPAPAEELGAELSELQKKQWTTLKLEDTEIFSERPGKASGTGMEIRTEQNQPPVYSHPYRVNDIKRKILSQEIEGMLEEGIIKASDSPWSSPVVLVKKGVGEWRVCIDYRKLNAVTISDPFPMPRIDELLDLIGRARYITTLDMTKGYWQLPVSPEHAEKTAFTTQDGKWEFTRIPFGLKNAPAHFQRYVNGMLINHQDYARAYLDDVVVFSDTWEDHLLHLSRVLKEFRIRGLTLKARKCQIGMGTCKFLGHIVGQGKIQPAKAKITAVMEFERPKRKKQIQAFLGLAGYYRKFVQNFSVIATPLTQALRKDQPDILKWTPEMEGAFQQLKRVLTTDPVLSSPDPKRGYCLQTDASGLGIGAVLCQSNDQGEEHPVAFFSRKLSPAETNYSAVELECLGVVKAIEHFQIYLSGAAFKIQTDHKALVYLEKFKETKSRLIRWALALQPYSFTIEHKRGVSNTNADGLSRQYKDTPPQIEGEGELLGSGHSPDHTLPIVKKEKRKKELKERRKD